MSTNRAFRFALAILLAACSCRRASAWASSGEPQWPQGNIVMQLQVDTIAPSQTLLDGSTTWSQVVTGALSDWNAYLTTSRFTWVLNSSAPANSDANTANGYNNVRWGDTVYGESWGAGGGDVAGIALTWYTNDKMVEGDVLFNSSTGVQWNSYRGNLRYGSNGQSINDLKRIALHEFGHVLGLDHPDQHGQSVAAIMNSVESNTDDLTADDIAGGEHFYSAVLPPVITQQPIAAQTVTLGGSTSAFSVYVQGTPPFTYQWYHNNVALTGSSLFTSWAFSLSNVTNNDTGTYYAVVTNSAGSVTSGNSVLSLAGSAPAIVTQPASQTVSVGASATFTVVATGAAPLAYQWSKNGTAIAGATSATYSIASVTSSSAGNYTVVVTNAYGSATSNAATLTAVTGPTAWISNLSVRANMAAGQTMIVGFTVAGNGAQNVLVRAIGPGLFKTFPQFFTASSVMADPNLAYYPNGASSATSTNDNWDSSLASVFASVGAFPLDAGSKDAAFVQSISGANNTVWVRGTGGGYVLVEGYAIGASASPRLSNISARNQVGTGADILIAGFVLQGSGNKTLLVRGIGPALKTLFNIGDALTDPIVEIHDSADNVVASNNDWDSNLTATFDQVGAYHFATGSKDAALLVSLPASAAGTGYTAQVKGNNGLTGEAVVEVYEVQP